MKTLSHNEFSYGPRNIVTYSEKWNEEYEKENKLFQLEYLQNASLEQLRETIKHENKIARRYLCMRVANNLHPFKLKKLTNAFVRAIELAAEDKRENGENALLTLCRMDRVAMRRYMGMKEEEILANYVHNDLKKKKRKGKNKV